MEDPAPRFPCSDRRICMLLTLVSLVGGLGLFIAGMNMMSRGIEKVAGTKLRAILAAFTKTKFLGLVVGLFFTAVIQSSSAATVMVVSFVNSGLMQLGEACGIILGANIGTTVTALLVAFKLSAIAPVFVFAGAVMMNYIKQPFARKLGEVVLGFGILFVGISTMSSAMGELREQPAVINALQAFTNPFLGLLMGLVITSVVQSSSVTVSILVVMGASGLVTLDACMYVILGCNIGACTSAMLSEFFKINSFSNTFFSNDKSIFFTFNTNCSCKFITRGKLNACHTTAGSSHRSYFFFIDS